VQTDVSRGVEVDGEIDGVVNLASPASPPAYLARPLETLLVGSEGTRHLLDVARHHDARFVQASTSEVYGDPTTHPQGEDYWGHVNPVGPRSVYDESKRFGEALVMAHRRALGSDTAIARIFNTYGPRLGVDDGRVVSNFIVQALAGRPLTIYGDGSHTRSLCYVSDMVGGLLALLDADATGPINLGNPTELSVAHLAQRIIDLTGSSSTMEHRDLPLDDPARRCPDITRARSQLQWEPVVDLDDGLTKTIAYFQGRGPGGP
jgi:dTDP-glucose 4,6-dehydratase